MTAEQLAQLFHETYERLAPQFGYVTRRDSANPWAEVPEVNRKLMTAVCGEILVHAAAQLAELTAKLPETFFVGHDLAFRLERLVDGWQRAVTANLTLEARLAEKEREIEDLQTKCRDMAVALGNQIARAEAAEQRLQEAQARIKYLENVKVRAERGERSTS